MGDERGGAGDEVLHGVTMSRLVTLLDLMLALEPLVPRITEAFDDWPEQLLELRFIEGEDKATVRWTADDEEDAVVVYLDPDEYASRSYLALVKALRVWTRQFFMMGSWEQRTISDAHLTVFTLKAKDASDQE